MNWLQRIAQLPQMSPALSYNRAAEIIPQVIAGNYDIEQAIRELQPESLAACALIDRMMATNVQNPYLIRLNERLCGQAPQTPANSLSQYPAGIVVPQQQQSEGDQKNV